MKRILTVLTAMFILACGGAAPPDREELSEELAERLLEAAAGEDVEIELQGDGGTFTIGDQVITASGDGQNWSMTGPDGNFEATMGQPGEVPADWPVPMPDGGTVQSVIKAETDDGTLLTVVVEAPGSRSDIEATVVEAVKGLGELKSQVGGDDVLLQVQAADGTIWHVQLTGSDGEITLISARLTPSSEAGGAQP